MEVLLFWQVYTQFRDDENADLSLVIECFIGRMKAVD